MDHNSLRVLCFGRVLEATFPDGLPSFGIGGGGGEEEEEAAAARNGEESGRGMLLCAAAHNNVFLCKLLVDMRGVDANTTMKGGRTPLLAAASHGDCSAAMYLLDRGAGVARTDDEGRTPLHLAAKNGHCEVAAVLLARGAAVDAANSGGTPLQYAALHGKHQAVKILLDHNADPNKTVFLYFTPLISSIYARSLECTEMLIKAGANVNGDRSRGEMTPLTLAIDLDLPKHIKCLLKAGADPNTPSKLGDLPIEEAAIHGRRKAAKILLPFTFPRPTCRVWSVNGIMEHVNSEHHICEEKILAEVRKDDLKAEADDAFKQKDYHAATMLYSLAMSAVEKYGFDRDATLYANRSLCCLRIGEGIMALVDADTCIELRPTWPKAYYRRGAALSFLKDYKQACDAFLAGFTLDPENDEMEKALWEAVKSVKAAHCAGKGL